MDPILYEANGGVATFTLNRPEVYNSFNREMAFALQHYLKACATSEDVRCIVIKGAGKAFCAGQDLNEVTGEEAIPLAQIISEHYNPIIKLIRELEKPIIAAVNGVAAGAGANMALSCDLTVAKESVSFVQAFSKIGLIPDSGGTFFLPRLVGLQRAIGMAYLSNKIPAKEAERIGLIYKAIPDEGFDEFIDSLAQKMAAMPTRALGLTKRAFNQSFTNDLDTQLGIEEQLQAAAGLTEDYAEGVNAFLEKRKPEFTGK